MSTGWCNPFGAKSNVKNLCPFKWRGTQGGLQLLCTFFKMKPVLISIHGPMAVGKSTICSHLYNKLKDYVFVDKAYIKDTMLKRLKKTDREKAKEIANKVTVYMLEQVIPLQKHILLQEMRYFTIQKHVGDLLKKNNYRVVSFYLECSVEEAKKRDFVRINGQSRPGLIEEMHAKHGFKDPQDIVINTEENDVEQTVSLILREIK